MFEAFGQTMNNAFFFVVDKIIDMQAYFIDFAKGTGRIVFLIAILSAALNYALTGTGLKENLIKIFKATVFFMIAISFYPRIIGWIASQTFSMAHGSIGESVSTYFAGVTKKVEYINYDTSGRSSTIAVINSDARDYNNLFSDLTVKRNHSRMSYTAIAPANMFKILFIIAEDCMGFADGKQKKGFLGVDIPDFSRVLKGLICAFFIILTGAFAILEYLVCFLEFMLVTSVGIILFPLSIWDGSKFLAEGFIKAIVGFFLKMLFCNIAIFLMLYGFVSLLYTISSTGFTGTVDQIIFIIFVCLLFFFICKSAPGVAQSLLTGTPSLNGAGAIAAATGAFAAAKATTGLAQKVGGKVAGGVTKATVGGIGSFIEANAAKNSAMETAEQAGGDKNMIRQAGNSAFRSSLISDVGDSFKTGALGLTRNLLGGDKGGSSGGGGGTNPHSWRQSFLNDQGENGHKTFSEHLKDRRQEGALRGRSSAEKNLSKWGLPAAAPASQPAGNGAPVSNNASPNAG